MDDHIHLRHIQCGEILLLTVEDRIPRSRLVRRAEQKGAAPRCHVVDGDRPSVVGADVEQLGGKTTRLGGGVELPLRLTALGREVTHQVLVGIAEEVVIGSVISTKVEIGVLEDGDQVAYGIDEVLALA